MLHNSHEMETILPSHWLILFLSKFQYGENKDDTSQGRGQKKCGNADDSLVTCEGGGSNLGTSTCRGSGTPRTSAAPSLEQETPLGMEEIIRRITKVGWLEEVGRSPQSLPN